jgi:hypothetical protein
MGSLVTWARELAAISMAEELPRRWAHVQAVAAKAENLRPIMGHEADVLVAAAWLHDVGYASSAADSGFHPSEGGELSRLDDLLIRSTLGASRNAQHHLLELLEVRVDRSGDEDADAASRPASTNPFHRPASPLIQGHDEPAGQAAESASMVNATVSWPSRGRTVVSLVRIYWRYGQFGCGCSDKIAVRGL